MFKNFHKNKYNSGSARPSYSGGVTLIELLVVIFIFMVISSITIFSYGKFNSSLSLQNLADDIALSVRRAQGYAIGVRGYGNSFNEGYGVHFTTADSTSGNTGSKKSFVLFSNIKNNDKYDYDISSLCGAPTSDNECLEIFKITSYDKISEISVIGNEDHTADTLDIFFKRPKPEPTFCARNNGDSNSDCNFGINVSSVKITISNDNGVFKIITISNVGQISVSNN